MDENFNSDNQPVITPPGRSSRALADLSTAELSDRQMMDTLLNELRSMAFIDIAGMYDGDNCLLSVHDMDPAVRRAIASIETDELWSGSGSQRKVIGQTKKVKLWDKRSSIETFMKHLGMFIDRLETTSKIRFTSESVEGKTDAQLIEMLTNDSVKRNR